MRHGRQDSTSTPRTRRTSVRQSPARSTNHPRKESGSEPIRPENKHRYPKNWREIRIRTLARAGNRCEGVPGTPCGVANYAIVRRYQTQDLRKWKDIRIVLTIAHLDHTPENNDPRNLRALCQQCHNRYDAKVRAEGRKSRMLRMKIEPKEKA